MAMSEIGVAAAKVQRTYKLRLLSQETETGSFYRGFKTLEFWVYASVYAPLSD